MHDEEVTTPDSDGGGASQIESWLAEANQLIVSGDWDAALAIVERVLSVTSSADRLSLAFGLKSVALFQLNRLPEALAAAQVAEATDPQLALAQVMLAVALSQLRRFEQALAAAARAVELAPTSALAHRLEAQLLSNLGRQPEALAAAARALSLDATDWQGWHVQGIVLARLGRYDEAVAAYDAALDLVPRDGEEYRHILLNEVRACYQWGHYDEALSKANRLCQLDPSAVDAWDVATASLVSLRRWEEAIAASDEYITLQPDSLEAWLNKATSLYALGRLDDALTAYDRILAIEPHNERARKWRSIILARLYAEGQWPDAIRLETEPELQSPKPWLNASAELQKLKRYDAAVVAADGAIARAPDDPVPVGVKFRILRDRLRLRKAWPVFREYVRLQIEQRNRQ